MTVTRRHPAPLSTGLPPTARWAQDGPLPLAPGTPWSVRCGRTRAGRPALEVYQDGELVDVLSASRLAPRLLCGVRSTTGSTLAWGRLPAEGAPPAVRFTARRLRRSARSAPAEVATVAGEFWLAWAPGRFTAVRTGPAAG